MYYVKVYPTLCLARCNTNSNCFLLINRFISDALHNSLCCLTSVKEILKWQNWHHSLQNVKRSWWRLIRQSLFAFKNFTFDQSRAEKWLDPSNNNIILTCNIGYCLLNGFHWCACTKDRSNIFIALSSAKRLSFSARVNNDRPICLQRIFLRNFELKNRVTKKVISTKIRSCIFVESSYQQFISFARNEFAVSDEPNSNLVITLRAHRSVVHVQSICLG